MSAKQQPGRWDHLPAAERRRREAQSATDRARATAAVAPAARAEAQRPERQRRADRERAEIEDSIHFTVYGGDINMMDRNDW